mmetsp:Transcript_24250/g.55227  ORF Transcript_24250/g.55227 Transcript_24250/m.55227 type:complete len:83 (+) Transcript_24250:1274-1522(+)
MNMSFIILFQGFYGMELVFIRVPTWISYPQCQGTTSWCPISLLPNLVLSALSNDKNRLYKGQQCNVDNWPSTKFQIQHIFMP